jgi:hypothetical protein
MGIAHFAHLGGFVGGWLYLVVLERNSPARRFRQRAESVPVVKPGTKDLSRWEAVDPGGLHPLNRDEFVKLLEKARSLGPPALSAQERAFMDRFTQG